MQTNHRMLPRNQHTCMFGESDVVIDTEHKHCVCFTVTCMIVAISYIKIFGMRACNRPVL